MLYIAPGISPTAMNSTVQYQWEPIGVVTHQKHRIDANYTDGKPSVDHITLVASRHHGFGELVPEE